MPELHPILLAGLTGFVSGLLLSIPVGPINLTIMNEGTRRGFFWAMLIGLGATAMEVIYCFIAFTGFASFFSQGYVKAAMELFSFVFMLVLGVKFLLAKSVGQRPVDLGAVRRRQLAGPQYGFEWGLCPFTFSERVNALRVLRCRRAGSQTSNRHEFHSLDAHS